MSRCYFLYLDLKKNNNYSKGSPNEFKKIDIYNSFILKNNICPGNKIECKNHVHISKHNHGLVLLYSNFDWSCKIYFSKNDSTYNNL